MSNVTQLPIPLPDSTEALIDLYEKTNKREALLRICKRVEYDIVASLWVASKIGPRYRRASYAPEWRI